MDGRSGTGLPSVSAEPVRWPAAIEQSVTVPGTGRPVQVGASGLSLVARGTDDRRVAVQTFDHRQVAALGGIGLAFTLAADPSSTGSGAVPDKSTLTVQADASDFAGAAGGNLMSRLRVVELPACALTTPDRPECLRQKVLPSSVDLATQTVKATVPVQAATGISARAVSADAAGPVFALAAGTGGETGSFAATPLSSAARWAVSGGAGGFSWTHPIPAVHVPGGSQPSLNLSYSSQAVDGMVASENSQPSWTGLGWDLGIPFIERRYMACDDDRVGEPPVPVTGYAGLADDCWAGDDLELSLAGRSSPLVRDQAAGGDVWRPRDDPGWRVERLTGAANGDNNGEYWQVQTPDGVRYTFGKGAQNTTARTTNSVFTVPVYGNQTGEPCHGGSVADSWCQQAWRWNLDATVDPHGNEASYFYTKETNSYARTGTTTTPYVRGGYLNDIEYGLRAGAENVTAPARLHFQTALRCTQIAGGGATTCPALTATSPKTDYPDVPADRLCTAQCTESGPSFFTGVLLRSVTAQRSTGATWTDVDTLAFDYGFPAPSDGTDASLWLSSIRRTGQVGGTSSLPPITFAGTELTNRVELAAVPLRKLRVSSVVDELGRRLDVTYGRPDPCVDGQLPRPAENVQDCFPAWRIAGPNDQGFGWWNKYLVTQLKTTDTNGGSPPRTTQYRYGGTPAWHYDDTLATPIRKQSWSDWRGYGRVDVVQLSDPGYRGEATSRPLSLTRTLYFRGMDGDRVFGDPFTGMGKRRFSVTDSTGTTVDDDPWLTGQVREQQNFALDAAGDPTYELAGSLSSYGVSRLTPTTPGTPDPKHDAHLVVPTRQVQRETVIADPGGARTTRTSTSDVTYDSYGQVLTVTSSAPGASAAGGGSDIRCTRTSYARDAGTVGSYLLRYPNRVRQYSGSCANPTTLVSGTDTYYDGSTTLGAPLTHADPTRADAARTASAPDTVSATISTSNTFDVYGRLLRSTDANGRVMSKAYTPATGIATSMTSTNALGQVATTTLDPSRELTLSTRDANNQTTALGYDPLGRLTTVRLPGQAAGDPANTVYTYRLDAAKALPPEVTTRTLQSGSTYVSSYQFLNSSGQPRQTQTVSPASTAAAPKTIIGDTRYDDRGMAAVSTLPVVADGAAGSALIGIGPAAASETRTSFDAIERPTKASFYTAGTLKWSTTTDYFGDHARVTPPTGGAVTTGWIDIRGRTIRSEQGTGSDLVATGYRYDDADRPVRMTDPAGHVGTVEYDLLGRTVRSTDPDAGTTSTTYDGVGNPLTTTDALGTLLSTSYDALNRPTATWKGAVGSGQRLSTSTYDSTGISNGIGRLASQTSYATADLGKAYTQSVTGYTARGEVAGRSWTFPAGVGLTLIPTTFKTSYTYDQMSHQTSISYPDRVVGLDPETVTTGYDALGYATTLTGVQTPLIGATKSVNYATTSFAADGKLAGRSYANPLYPVSRRYSYEPDTQRLSNISTLVGDPVRAGTTAKQDDTYRWDAAGNLTSITDNSVPEVPLLQQATATCFNYDALDRISHAWSTAKTDCSDATSTTVHDGPSGFNQSWTYSADGNITSARSLLVNRSFGYNDANHPHAVTSAGADVFGYDADGQQNSRLKSLIPGVMTYTPQRQLESVAVGAAITRSVYAADGTRVARLNPDSTATLYLDGEEISVVKGVAAGIRYYRQAGTVVGQRIQTGSLIWQLNDTQGSAQSWIVGGTGLVKRTYYDPYGKVRDLSLPPATDHGFLGKVADPGTGLDQLGARSYDPDLGRFTSPDPIVDTTSAQSANAYGYALNNPVSYSDPTGLKGGIGLYWDGVNPATPNHPDGTVGSRLGRESSGGDTGDSIAGALKTGLSAGWGFLKGATEGGASMLTGLNDLNSTFNPTSPAFLLSLVTNPLDLVNSQWEVDRNLASMVVHPGKLWDAVTAPERDDWNNGRKSEAAGRATFDIATLVFGFIKLGKLSEIAGAARTTTTGGTLAGSGPVPGVLEASSRVKSLAALRNYYPKGGGVEFVFDPQTGTFAAGRPAASVGLKGSPHEQLAESIGADPATVVGGTFSRGAGGEFITTENSGHFWQNWTPEVRTQFRETMSGYGFDVR